MTREEARALDAIDPLAAMRSRFALPDGVIYLDGKSVPNTVTNEDKEADCTVAITHENLVALMTGELEPATGFMMGKFRVEGDMAVALKLQRVV